MELCIFLKSSFLNKAANGSPVENQRMDVNIHISVFSPTLALSPTGTRVCCISLLWFNWLTFTPGTKICLCYTLLIRIFLPNCKSSADCQAHLLSFSLFYSTGNIEMMSSGAPELINDASHQLQLRTIFFSPSIKTRLTAKSEANNCIVYSATA